MNGAGAIFYGRHTMAGVTGDYGLRVIANVVLNVVC